MSEERLELEKLLSHEVLPADAAGFQPRDYRLTGYRYPATGYAEEEKILLRELWRTMRKRKWLIISIVLVVTSLVTVEMFRTKPTYQASTTVEIGKDNNALVRSGDLIINDDSDPYYQVNIKTKMLLLNSRELHEDVVTDLKLDQNPKFLESDGGTSIWKALRSAFGKRTAEEESAESDDVTDQTSDDEHTRSPEECARLAPYVEALEENLSIEPVRDTRALKVSFIHTSPVIAAEVANGVARSFMQRNFQTKTEKFANTASWLDSSTRELKAKVEQSEQALANYMRENNIFSINDGKRESTTLTTDKLARLHDQALRTETERMLKQTLYEELKAGRIAQLPEAFSDPKLMELQKQLNDLQIAAAQLGVRYAPKNPKMVEVHEQIVAVQAQIEASRKDLEDKLKVEYERALQDEQSFKTALGTIKAEAVQENQAAIQYNILKQDVDTARALYTDFLQKTNQAKAQVAEQQNNIRVIERASLPKKPVGPKRVLMIMLAFMVSLGGSFGIVVFLEYIDNSIKSVDDVSRYVQLPSLGVIPTICERSGRSLSGKKKVDAKTIAGRRQLLEAGRDFKPGQLMAMESRSTAAEAYRALRTSVLLSSAGRPPKTVLVTSSQPGEGKTTTCVNIAISLAQLGASVLVIDSDMRKPTVHKVFGVDYLQGLSTFLSRNVEVDGLIQKLPVRNLSLLPCGPIPPNPAELISSERMKEMLATLGEQYDHILIDSPPLMNVTDPVILSTMVEGVILVVHGGKSSRDLVRRSRQELLGVGAKIFGVVLNNVDLRHEGYDNYYYSRYSYGPEQAPKQVALQ